MRGVELVADSSASVRQSRSRKQPRGILNSPYVLVLSRDRFGLVQALVEVTVSASGGIACGWKS